MPNEFHRFEYLYYDWENIDSPHGSLFVPGPSPVGKNDAFMGLTATSRTVASNSRQSSSLARDLSTRRRRPCDSRPTWKRFESSRTGMSWHSWRPRTVGCCWVVGVSDEKQKTKKLKTEPKKRETRGGRAAKSDSAPPRGVAWEPGHERARGLPPPATQGQIFSIQDMGSPA